jgi:hypothetical protein
MYGSIGVYNSRGSRTCLTAVVGVSGRYSRLSPSQFRPLKDNTRGSCRDQPDRPWQNPSRTQRGAAQRLVPAPQRAVYEPAGVAKQRVTGEPPKSLIYEPWRHGGWYVHEIVWPHRRMRMLLPELRRRFPVRSRKEDPKAISCNSTRQNNRLLTGSFQVRILAGSRHTATTSVTLAAKAPGDTFCSPGARIGAARRA